MKTSNRKTGGVKEAMIRNKDEEDDDANSWVNHDFEEDGLD